MRRVWSLLRTAEQQLIVNSLNDSAAFRLLEMLQLRCLLAGGLNATSGFFYIVDASNLKVFHKFSSPCVFECWWDKCRGVLFKTMIKLATWARTHSPHSPSGSLCPSAPVRFDLPSLCKWKAVVRDMTLVFKGGCSMKRVENGSVSSLQFYVPVLVHIP